MVLYGAPSTLPMFSPAVLQTGVVETFFLHSRLASLGCYSDGALLALLRSVVPYTLALFVAPPAGGVSGSGALQQRSFLADRLSPLLGGGPSSSKLFSSIIPEAPNYKSTNTVVCYRRPRVQKPSIDLLTIVIVGLH